MRRRVVIWAAALAAAATAFPARGLPPEAVAALASSNVQVVAALPDVPAIGGRLLGDTLYVTTSLGLRIYDVSNPALPLPLGALPLPHWENEDVDTNGEILLIAQDNSPTDASWLYVIDVSDAHLPRLRGTAVTAVGHTATCINDCTWAWMGGGGFVSVIDLRDPDLPRERGTFQAPGRVHDVQVDAAGIAWLSTGHGVYGYTTADPLHPVPVVGKRIPNDFIIHNSLRPKARSWRPRTWKTDGDRGARPGELLLITEEDWLGPFNENCARDGSFITARYVKTAWWSRIEELDRYNVGRASVRDFDGSRKITAGTCSAHYFTERNGVVAIAWYENGTRFLDVSNPRRIREIGYYVPVQGETWSAIWVGRYVYTLDAYRGIEVLQFTGKPGDPEVRGPTAVAAALSPPSPRWGYACRIPAA